MSDLCVRQKDELVASRDEPRPFLYGLDFECVDPLSTGSYNLDADTHAAAALFEDERSDSLSEVAVVVEISLVKHRART